MKMISMLRLVGMGRFVWLLVLSMAMLTGATVAEGQGAPPAPELHFPPSGHVMTGNRFALRWQNHLNPPAAHFLLRIYRRNPAANNNFTLYRAVPRAIGGQYLDHFAYMGGTYRWRVRGYNAFSRRWGNFSRFSNFQVPGGVMDGPPLIGPRGVDTIDDPPARFQRSVRFRAVQGAERYQVEWVMPQRTAIPPRRNQPGLPGHAEHTRRWDVYRRTQEGNVITTPVAGGTRLVLVPNETYRWRVRAMTRVRRGHNQAQWEAGPWSPWVSYTVRPTGTSAARPPRTFLLRSFARDAGPPSMYWWRGYRFQVSRPVEVYALYGGGTGDFSMGIYQANGNRPTRRLRAIPGNLTGRRQRRVINPITLRPGQDYILAQGRRSGGGLHYQLVGLENIRQHPILADWFPAVAPLRWQGTGNSGFIVDSVHLDLQAPPLDIGFDYR